MNILIVYPWELFWAMGEDSGVASFFHVAPIARNAGAVS